MSEQFTVLIADRNRHIRKFLEREIKAEGYIVRLASSAKEVLECVFKHEPVDLLVLDPDLPDAGKTNFLEKLGDRIPVLPIVAHSLSSDYPGGFSGKGISVFVEKNGNSIDHLKKVISQILREPPQRDMRALLNEKIVSKEHNQNKLV